MVREQVWSRMFKVDALSKQDGTCEYCHCPMTVRTATADHKIARKLGGTTRRENIVAACVECNRLKGHMTPGQFKLAIKDPSGHPIAFWLAWSRRRIFLATKRSCKNIMLAAT